MSQGGSETPFGFWSVTIDISHELLYSWNSREFGTDLGKRRLAHIWWCDNIFIFAKARVELSTMLSEFAREFHVRSMQWKLSSLHFMIPTRNADDSDIVFSAGDGHEYVMQHAEQIETLEAILDERGDSSVAAEHRVKKANIVFFRDFGLWRARSIPW